MGLVSQPSCGLSTGEPQVLHVRVDAIGFPQAIFVELVICQRGWYYWPLMGCVTRICSVKVFASPSLQAPCSHVLRTQADEMVAIL
jgi:hypothetical protein